MNLSFMNVSFSKQDSKQTVLGPVHLKVSLFAHERWLINGIKANNYNLHSTSFLSTHSNLCCSPRLKFNSQAQIQFRPTAELSKLSKATAIVFKRSTSTTMAKLINYNLYNTNQMASIQHRGRAELHKAVSTI